jgi:hypothetical protein
MLTAREQAETEGEQAAIEGRILGVARTSTT